MASQLRSRYDVVINGGGIVGFTLLNLIKRSPILNRCKVLLIEQTKKPPSFTQPPRIQKSENDKSTSVSQADSMQSSSRVSGVILESRKAFKELGVWDHVRPYAKDITRIEVLNYGQTHRIIFDQNSPSLNQDKNEANVVFSTVENNRLSYALLNNMHTSQQSPEQIIWNHKLTGLEESHQDNSIELKIEDNVTGEMRGLSAELVLGCDGNKSKVRELARIDFDEYDRTKSAVVGTVRMSSNLLSSENDVAYQKFLNEKDTVAALLPLDREHSSFVISAPNDYAAYLADCDDGEFVQEFNRLLSSSESPSNPILRGVHLLADSAYDNLNGIFQLLPGPFRPSISPNNIGLEGPPGVDYVISNSRASFPLAFGTTSPRMIGSLSGTRAPQIALLGDSAHRVHPLSGYGLNLGIQDAIELVEQLETLVKGGELLFEDKNMVGKILQRYELKRHQEPSKLAPKSRIEGLISATNKRVFVFMKGEPEAPACGYSNAVVQILNAYGVDFDSFNVLTDDDIRQEVKAYSNWPTIPQIYVDGSFIGGCDILIQMHQNNELESLLSSKS